VLLNIGTDIAIISLPISMVMQLQMKTKQKFGVAAIFALGFLVVIASSTSNHPSDTNHANYSVIRAYYSKKNETMLTCTVSMIETAVAIIATCLPPLRTLFLGQMSSARTGSNYAGRYELSSTGRNQTRRTNQSRITTNVMGGTQNNDSQDELFKESATAHSVAPSTDKTPGITVNTTILMQHSSEDEARRSQARLDHFA
jgi:hypothetical protein